LKTRKNHDIDEKKKLKLAVLIFGRETLLDLTYLQIEKE
jgi:transcription antitermination factor NusG